MKTSATFILTRTTGLDYIYPGVKLYEGAICSYAVSKWLGDCPHRIRVRVSRRRFNGSKAIRFTPDARGQFYRSAWIGEEYKFLFKRVCMVAQKFFTRSERAFGECPTLYFKISAA